VAFLYYWFLIAVYLCSPRIAYEFMELLEAHAVDTYSTFVKENRQRLKMLPPPAVATSYYTAGGLYFFDDFQMRPPGSRRPTCDSLLDVFVNICEDEGEHVLTMKACQDYALLGERVQSPHLVYRAKPVKSPDESERRKMWKMWATQINEKE
jgi:ubiquinol oxidase